MHEWGAETEIESTESEPMLTVQHGGVQRREEMNAGLQQRAWANGGQTKKK